MPRKEVKCALFGPGSKPGEPRDQTGRAPDSNRASPGIKPGEPRDQTRRAPGKGLSNLSKVSNAGGREKSVKSVSFVRFALSVEGVLSGEGRHPSLQVVYDFVVHYKLGRTGSNRAPPEKDCQICQKCQTPGGEKKSVKSVSFVRFALSVEGVPSLRSVSATGLVSRHRSEFGTSQAC